MLNVFRTKSDMFQKTGVTKCKVRIIKMDGRRNYYMYTEPVKKKCGVSTIHQVKNDKNYNCLKLLSKK